MAEESLEERAARIEGILEEMDKWFSLLKSDVASFRENMKSRFDRQFRWTVGLLLGAWTTTEAMLITILLKVLGVI